MDDATQNDEKELTDVGQLLLENKVKERASPPSPALGRIDMAAT